MKWAVGSQPPDGYVAWHEWAKAQHEGGLRQKRCGLCSLCRFPQEMSGRTVTSYPTRGKGGPKVKVTSPVCRKCASRKKEALTPARRQAAFESKPNTRRKK